MLSRTTYSIANEVIETHNTIGDEFDPRLSSLGIQTCWGIVDSEDKPLIRYVRILKDVLNGLLISTEKTNGDVDAKHRRAVEDYLFDAYASMVDLRAAGPK